MRDLASKLKQKITDRDATIGVIGLGYVGLPLAVEFADAGFHVTGIDVDTSKVKGINAGKSHVQDVPGAEVARLVKKRKLTAKASFRGCGKFDAIIICVPTPLRKTKDPDISYIVAATSEISREMRAGQLIILESTTYPGTTEEVVRGALETSKLKGGRDFYLAFSPERVDPGNETFKTHNTPKVVGGSSPDCTEVAALLYRQVIDTVHTVSSTEAAEMIKLLENTFRAVNIALVNEVSLMCEKLGVDVWEVIEGAATKPFGYMPFFPGPGIGGHCIPLDPHYLSWKLKTLNYSARFIELASEINGDMPSVVVRRISSMLNNKKLSVNGARVMIVGTTYKRDTGDARESPAVDVMKLLGERGARLSYHDPFVPQIDLPEYGTIRRSALSEKNLKSADIVVIITDHTSYDYAFVVRHSRQVLDTRNATRDVRGGRSKIQKL